MPLGSHDGVAASGVRVGLAAVSLTGQLRDGALGSWCAATLTGAPAMAVDVATRAAAPTGRPPVRPHQVTDSGHWATIGGAFGQRLAFAAQHAPPYYALLGAHRAGLADWATVQRCAAAFPTHAGLDPGRAARANQLRPLPGGDWLDLDRAPTADGRGRSTVGARSALLLDLVERLVAFLGEHAPPGRLATGRGAEAVLARACVVLTDCESAYRGGALPPDAAARWAHPATTATDLLDAVPDHQVAELLDLAARAHTARALAHLAPAPPAPPTITGPVLVEHWADGDLLIPTRGPGDDDTDHPAQPGRALVDVKTVASVRDPQKVTRWLWQLLAYAWLDPDDRHRVRAVGLYLARHGELITWPLPSYAAALLDGGDVDAARAEFRALAARAWAAESGRPAPTRL